MVREEPPAELSGARDSSQFKCVTRVDAVAGVVEMKGPEGRPGRIGIEPQYGARPILRPEAKKALHRCKALI